MREIQTSFEFMPKDVADMKAAMAKQSEHNSTLQSYVFKVWGSLLAVTDKMEYF